MDDLITVPGTKFGLGLDALVGLLPGVGDVLSSTIACTIVFDALRRRVPVPVLARMGLNVLLDVLLGLLPAAGDLLDIAFRANSRNLRLLETSLATGRDSRPLTPGYLLAAGVLAVLPLVLGIVVSAVVLWLLLRWLLG
jgi:hypothetical protein